MNAEWVLCQSDTARTWHYFDAGHNKSRCGASGRYQVAAAGLNRISHMSSMALQEASFCGRCDRKRRAEEGR